MLRRVRAAAEPLNVVRRARTGGQKRLAVLLGLGAVLAAARAEAHAPPEIFRVLWPDPAHVVLLTNRGLVFGDPAARDFRLMCNEALDINVYEKPDIVALDGGGLLVATSVGLQRSDDGGCSWSHVFPSAELAVPALAQDPARPSRVYLSTFGPGEGAIRLTEDGAQTFQSLLVLPDNDYVLSLRVSPAEADRVYAAGSTFERGEGYGHYVARSTDAGRSWTRAVVAVLDTEVDVSLLAVSPADADLVLARATSTEPSLYPDRLLVSRDGGESFSSPVSIDVMVDAAFSEDGKTVWVAGQRGLFRSTDDLQTFTRLGDAEQATCVAAHGGELFVCGYFQGAAAAYSEGMNGLGVSPDGAVFRPWMKLRDVNAPVDCPADKPTAGTCATPWSDWRAEVPYFVDAGAPSLDGGDHADAAPEPSSGPRRETGCAVATPRGSPGTPVLLAAVAACLVQWRRRAV